MKYCHKQKLSIGGIVLKKISIIPLLLIASVIISGCCIAKNVEAEEGVKGIRVEFEAISPMQTSVSEMQYWTQIPDTPLGYRPYYPDDVPTDIWEAAVKWGGVYNISQDILCGIAKKETGLQNINSKNGLYHGVMQIHPPSHRRRMKEIGVTDLSDVDQNMHVAAHYLRELLNEHNDIAIALMRYHGESNSNIVRYQNTGKMSSYARTILDYAAEFEAYHEQKGVFE